MRNKEREAFYEETEEQPDMKYSRPNDTFEQDKQDYESMPNATGGFFITDVRQDEAVTIPARKWSVLENSMKTRPETVTI